MAEAKDTSDKPRRPAVIVTIEGMKFDANVDNGDFNTIVGLARDIRYYTKARRKAAPGSPEAKRVGGIVQKLNDDYTAEKVRLDI